MTAGGFDGLLKVRARDARACRRLPGGGGAALPHVVRTSTFAAMETMKNGLAFVLPNEAGARRVGGA